jgi:hypothetical protein
MLVEFASVVDALRCPGRGAAGDDRPQRRGTGTAPHRISHGYHTQRRIARWKSSLCRLQAISSSSADKARSGSSVRPATRLIFKAQRLNDPLLDQIDEILLLGIAGHVLKGRGRERWLVWERQRSSDRQRRAGRSGRHRVAAVALPPWPNLSQMTSNPPSSQSFSQSLGATPTGGSVLARQARKLTTTADRGRSISLTGVTGTRVRIRLPPPQSLQTLGPSCGPIQPGGRDKR